MQYNTDEVEKEIISELTDSLVDGSNNDTYVELV